MILDENAFIEDLIIKLKNPAYSKNPEESFSPDTYKNRLQELQKNTNPKLSAVLILLYKKDNEWHFPLIHRTEYGPHKGQISLPGGKKDITDNTLTFTAKRETEEEVGIPIEDIEILGGLPEVYIPPSKFLVSPFVGITGKESPVFTPNPDEVQALIEVPLKELLLDKNLQYGSVPVGENLKIKTKYLHLNSYQVWGATAMMLSAFKSVLKAEI